MKRKQERSERDCEGDGCDCDCDCGCFLLEDVISEEECEMLIHIQRSYSVGGYIPCLSITSLLELWDKAEIVPVLKIREKVRDLTEEHFGMQFNLNVEYTALACWYPGSSISAHADNNRDYLRQRDYTAILYLNDGGGINFKGGDFFFNNSEGTPTSYHIISSHLISYHIISYHIIS
eukprot:TRINITY_DN10967_c0_g1_i2.p1 TRINITY_DN10967_c0_g1~~TRINITY_DN10967_c0_g1_i2.p1  ORF type:complete len:177 (-),score=44.63 TRINITY_DN10967_c0_g1_i2:88-618(-)